MTTGYLPQDIITILRLFSQRAAIDTKQIQSLIDSYSLSSQVLAMFKADKYYMGKHDILDTYRYYYIDREPQRDVVSADNKLPNPYLSILINQKVSRVVGKPISVSVSGANNKKKPDTNADAFQEHLLRLLGETFHDKMQDWVTGSSKHAIEWVHFYVNPSGELRYLVCPAQQIIPIFDTQYEDRLQYVIRYYQYDFIDQQGKTKKLYKVEWWSSQDVTYWQQIEDGSFVLDVNYSFNPMPHWFIKNESLSTKEPHGWGKVPFIPLYNNSKGATDLSEIKPLIDAYDKVYSGWCNDIEDFAEQILIVKNLAIKDKEFYQGMKELNIFMCNLKESKVVTVEGDKGDVKSIKADIPIEAKKEFLKITREAIFYFGEGVDVSNERFGASISGVALQHLYALLDMKCSRTILKLSQALKEFFWFVTTYINNATGNKYDPYLITWKFNESQIFNKKETIDGIVASKDILSRKTLIGLHPDVKDVDEELTRIEEEKATGADNEETARLKQEIEEMKQKQRMVE